MAKIATYIAQGTHARYPFLDIFSAQIGGSFRLDRTNMYKRSVQIALRLALCFAVTFILFAAQTLPSLAAPYAAMVVDARSGKVLHARNADTRLHPASLTKMMTLYITFEAIRNGELSLDQKVTISKNAAAEPPSKLGLRSGQKIAIRYLIRAAAVKSANDAATALGEAIAGSEAAFARRMTRTAKALGMTKTTFKNAHGLTAKGHLSTASDMTTLGRHILYDYPEYYNLFSRTSTDAGLRVVYNTNRRLLGSYKGADGIKTGYTNAAGYNLVASAKRGDERIIATVFGGTSTPARNAKVAELLDLGFRRAPKYAKLRKPALPRYQGNAGVQVAASAASAAGIAKPVKIGGSLKNAPRPRLRPKAVVQIAATAEVVDTARQDSINSILVAVNDQITVAPKLPPKGNPRDALTTQAKPLIDLGAPQSTSSQSLTARTQTAPETVVAFTKKYTSAPRPRARPQTRTAQLEVEEPVVVTRLSTSGGRYWGINVGRYTTRYQAEKVLLRTALAEMETLGGSLRKVVQSPRGFDAHFLGMSHESAEIACQRLRSRNVTCETLGPKS